jgi:hypothetical protein
MNVTLSKGKSSSWHPYQYIHSAQISSFKVPILSKSPVKTSRSPGPEEDKRFTYKHANKQTSKQASNQSSKQASKQAMDT